MASLLNTLRNLEPFVLPLLAQAWGIDEELLDNDDLIRALHRAMSDPMRVRRMLATLENRQQSALQMIANNTDQDKIPGTMLETSFALMYGQVRKRGAGDLERVNPLNQPDNIAESLYYRGLIGLAYETSKSQGARRIVFIPDEILPVIKGHDYKDVELDEEFDESLIDEDEAEAAQFLKPQPLEPEAEPEPSPRKRARKAAADPYPQVSQILPVDEGALDPESVRRADTSAVDDLVTLLAYTRIRQEILEDGILDELESEGMQAHLLTPGVDRLIFLVGLSVGMGMMDKQKRQVTVRDAQILPQWLQAARPDQVRMLAEGWRISQRYVDLVHVPGIVVEANSALDQAYPVGARKAILEILSREAPRSEWWALDDLVALCWHKERHFQRPNADYDSWYIRGADDTYLWGEESWHAVDAALIRFILTAPLHWLGMVDLAQARDGRVLVRFSAYGQAFVFGTEFPRRPEVSERITLSPDGRIAVTRKTSRFERYQIARFTTWLSAGQTYEYQIDGESLQRARQQRLTIELIGNLLTKLSSAALPDSVANLLRVWSSGERASVSLEHLLVLRVTSADVLDALFNDPAVRRFLGARLGQTDVIVRDSEGLRQALGERGIHVEQRS